MMPIENIQPVMDHISDRHETFRRIFSGFQSNLEHLGLDTFPVRRILVENETGRKTTIFFINRVYELVFSSIMIERTLKGEISVFRILDETKVEINNVSYNGESIVNIDPPNGEDPVSLAEQSCCLNLVLNWILDEIYT